MIDNSENNKFDHIALWFPSGRTFAIHDQKEFFRIVMPIYFPGMTSYKSFRRQLSLYGIYQQREQPSTTTRKKRQERASTGGGGVV
jgi:hypothetical protein